MACQVCNMAVIGQPISVVHCSNPWRFQFLLANHIFSHGEFQLLMANLLPHPLLLPTSTQLRPAATKAFRAARCSAIWGVMVRVGPWALVKLRVPIKWHYVFWEHDHKPWFSAKPHFHTHPCQSFIGSISPSSFLVARSTMFDAQINSKHISNC